MFASDSEVSRVPVTTISEVIRTPIKANCGICKCPDAEFPICFQNSSGRVHKDCLSDMLKQSADNSDGQSCPYCNTPCPLFIKTLMDLSIPIGLIHRAIYEKRQTIDNLQPDEKLV